MSKTLHRTPVAHTVLGLTLHPKGYARQLAAGMLSVVAIGLPLTTFAQPQDAQGQSIAAQAPSASSQLEPVLSDVSVNPSAVAEGATATFPRTGSVRNNQAAFDQLIAGQGSTSLAKSQNNSGAPWVLKSEAHPWPLRYQGPNPLSSLYLRTPDPRDARIMLPGVAADDVEKARFTANKFIVDAVALGAQARGRQLEELTQWIDRTKDQLKHVDTSDPWQAYQFSMEAHQELMAYQAKVRTQSDPSISAMADQIKQAIAQITPVMEVIESYDLRMAWYNIMVLLKEGLTLYQTQTLGADKQLLDLIDQFVNEHPLVARPDGPLPLTPEQAQAKKAASGAILASPSSTVLKAERSPAPDAISVEPTGSGLVGGLIVAIVALLASAGVFFTVFRRNKGKSLKPSTES